MCKQVAEGAVVNSSCFEQARPVGSGVHVAFCTPQLSPATGRAGGRQGMVNPLPGSPAVGRLWRTESCAGQDGSYPCCKIPSNIWDFGTAISNNTQ